MAELKIGEKLERQRRSIVQQRVNRIDPTVERRKPPGHSDEFGWGSADRGGTSPGKCPFVRISAAHRAPARRIPCRPALSAPFRHPKSVATIGRPKSGRPMAQRDGERRTAGGGGEGGQRQGKLGRGTSSRDRDFGEIILLSIGTAQWQKIDSRPFIWRRETFCREKGIHNTLIPQTHIVFYPKLSI